MRSATGYIFLIILLLVLFCLDLMVGSSCLAPGQVWQALSGNGDMISSMIVLGVRLPKAITAISAGMALSVAGMLMQTFFRNPLAGPYVLGVNSLSSLAVAVFMLAGGAGTSLFFKMGVPFAAIVGALGGLFLLLALSRRMKNVTHLLLAGMMIGFLAGAVQSVLEYLADPGSLKNFVLWNMASLSGVIFGDLVAMFFINLLICLCCLFLIKPLNALILGEEQAKLLGISTTPVKTTVLVLVAVLSGVTTAYCGPIGFVGLAIPHVIRMLLKTTHHLHQLMGCILGGAVFMLTCDIISNLPLFDNSLPINVITSLFGAPFVIWLLFNRKNSIG